MRWPLRFSETAHRSSQGYDMNKWYQPFGLLLLAAMVGELSGCGSLEWLPFQKIHEENQ